jgi:hypothetical protein
MSTATNKNHLALAGGWARNLAAGMVFLATLLPCLGAFWLGWSSGLRGEHKGDEAIRDVLVAVGLLAFGLAFAVLFVAFFLRDILVRVNQLEGDLSRRDTTPTPPGPRSG